MFLVRSDPVSEHIYSISTYINYVVFQGNHMSLEKGRIDAKQEKSSQDQFWRHEPPRMS